MGRHLPYKPRDYSVGQNLLMLRTRTKLTQGQLAALVGVNRRSIQHWENGEAYPKENSLQRLIAVFLSQRLFSSGHEQAEAAQLWEQISAAAPRPLALFDATWFAQLLTEHVGLPTPVTPSMAPSSAPDTKLPTGLVMFLATDIEGSTQRWEHAPQAMQQALARHHAILRQLTELYRGQVFHTAGDSFICVFAGAPAALQSALSIQRALLAEPWPEAVAPLRVRMAIHSGAAAASAEGYVAEPTLNRLSRVLSASQGGQIVLTQAAVDLIGTEWPEGIMRRDLGVQQLRDVTVPLQLWQAVAPDLPAEVQAGHVPATTVPVMDWGEANDVPILYGREAEQTTLEQWILVERCRVVALLGLGGMGKTSLAITLAQQLAPRFEVVLFRSLRNAPPLGSLLDGLIRTASMQQMTPPDTIADKILRMIQLCRERRCLLVLDNLETIMQAGDQAGGYRADYANYGELVSRFSEMQHQSCLLLTSREKPAELEPHEGPTATVRSLTLGGLAEGASQFILAEKALSGTDADWVDLAHRYGGNPLALKLIAGPIRELFGGDVSAFLTAGEAFFNSVGRLLEQQVSRAGAFEQSLLFWLAIEREPCSLDRLLADLGQIAHRGAVVAALEALQHRSLIERGAGRLTFTLQPVILEYMTERLVRHLREEIADGEPELLRSHALVQATAKDYVRRSQERLIATPLLERLSASYGDMEEVERRLLDLLGAWRDQRPTVQGYGPGNLVNLLRVLRGNLRGLDLSRLFIRHAYLQEITTQDTSLAGSHLVQPVLIEPFASILSIALSADGRVLVAGTSTGEVRLWRLADRTPILSIQGHPSAVLGVAISADGQIIASGGHDGIVQLWEASSGIALATLHGHTSTVYSVALAADAHVIASGSADGTVRLWDPSSGSALATLEGHNSTVMSITLSVDGNLVASGSQDGTVRLWETSGGTCLATLRGHAGAVLRVALSADGRLVASASVDGTARLWDVSSSRCLAVLQGHVGSVMSVALSMDSRLLASGGQGGTVRLWDVHSRECLATLQGHTSAVYGVALSTDGSLLTSGSTDGTVRLWDVHSRECLATLQGHTSAVYRVALSGDGQFIASGSQDGSVRLWNMRDRAPLIASQGHAGSILGIAFSADGQMIASGSVDGTVRLWDVPSLTCLATLRGHTGSVMSVAVAVDGQLIASGSQGGTVRLWDVPSLTCLATLRGHTGSVYSVALSADHRLIASGSVDATVRLWEVSSGVCLATLQGHAGSVMSVAVSANGQLVASGSVDGTVRLWDAASGSALATLREHTSGVYSVTLAMDGRLLISGGTDGTVRLWDTATLLSTEAPNRTSLAILRGHTSAVYGVALSADAQLVISGSFDGTVRLWEVATGATRRILHPDRPYERMDISGLTGVNEAQRAALKALGAVEREESEIVRDQRAHPIVVPGDRSGSGLQEAASVEALLTTKFFVPAAADALIARPRLMDVLDVGRQRPLTLISTPPGYGKTTLLAQWLAREELGVRSGGGEAVSTTQPLTPNSQTVAWISLDAADNDPVRFWLYVLTALDRCQPGLTETLITYVRAQQAPPLHTVVTMLINALAQCTRPLLLVLDDYHVITEAAVHRSLTYLLEHQPPQLRLIITGRTDPPLPLALLRARAQILDIRQEQLRATSDEVDAFLRQTMGLSLTPSEVAIVADRTEGWLAGLQLVALALANRSMSIDLLEQVRGPQAFILDYLTEEVLRLQPEAVQTFMLRTSILDRMCAPLCEAVLEDEQAQSIVGQQNSSPNSAQFAAPNAQSMLEQLERANLFVVPLDAQRRWYRYHTLFAEALRAHLERERPDEIPSLYLRASTWYRQQGYTYEAIQYAGQSHAWQQLVELIESTAQIQYQNWQQKTVRRWLEQLPQRIVRTRPQLCIVYALALFVAGELARVEEWLRAAEIVLTSAPEVATDIQPVAQDDQRRRMLGAIAARRAVIAGYYGDSETTERQVQQAFLHLSEDHTFELGVVAAAQGLSALSAGAVAMAAERLRQASAYMSKTYRFGAALNYLSLAGSYLHMQGRLHEAWQVFQEAIGRGTGPTGLPSVEVGVAYMHQAHILHEWNQVDAALTLVQQGLDLTEQAGYNLYLARGYIVLTRIYLSQEAWDAADAALQRALQLPAFVGNPYQQAWLVAIEQVRLWIGRGALERATGWATTLEQSERPTSPFAREREQVALARIDLAQRQPAQALVRLEPLFASATATGRWDHVSEMRLLQALAQEQQQNRYAALGTLAEAVRLGEQAGFVRRFVDEGPLVAALLGALRDQQRQHGPTPYLDSLLAAFLA